MIRKPDGAERESALRRTAEAGLQVGQWAKDNSYKAGDAYRSITGWLLAIMFLFGAITASSWGARIFGICLVSFFIFVFRTLGRLRRQARSHRA